MTSTTRPVPFPLPPEVLASSREVGPAVGREVQSTTIGPPSASNSEPQFWQRNAGSAGRMRSILTESQAGQTTASFFLLVRPTDRRRDRRTLNPREPSRPAWRGGEYVEEAAVAIIPSRTSR